MSRAAAMGGLLAAAVLLLPPVARPGPLEMRPGMGGVGDIGAMSCQAFSVMHSKGQSGSRQAVLYWTEGLVFARTGKSMDSFLAGLPDGGAAWNFESLTGHVVDWCEAHPEAPVNAAVEDLWRALGGAPGLLR
jgi:hypothetical protein